MAHFKVFDCWGQCITAYEETWAHATGGHQELVGHEGIVMTSLVIPVQLQESDTGRNTQLYIGPVVVQGIYAGEHPVSVVRLDGVPTTNRVWLTGYFTSLLPQGKVLWKKS